MVVDCLSCTTGIGLALYGVQYPNNSVVNIADIGTGSTALHCTITYRPCCSSAYHWYFPNGTRLTDVSTLPYYSVRSSAAVLLNCNSGATTTGVFHCDILDASGDLQSLYVGIYTATTGESRTLNSNNL